MINLIFTPLEFQMNTIIPNIRNVWNYILGNDEYFKF